MHSQKGFFSKTAACPSSTTLLSFRKRKLARELDKLVCLHLTACEFCNAELSLLAFHKPLGKQKVTPPEIPVNLRILAESLLSQLDKREIEVERSAELTDYKITV